MNGSGNNNNTSYNNNTNLLNYSVTQGDAASSAGDITPLQNNL